jgi:Cys-tRNA(Pro) deacylase
MTKIKIEKAKEMAAAVGLSAEFIEHEQSGKTTDDAVAALGIPASSILKTLILHSSGDEVFFGVIILGDDRLDFKKVAKLASVKKLRLASPEQIEKLTGFQLGGVPPLAVTFCTKGFIDEKVLQKDVVVGAGGDEHCGMRFVPRDLTRAIDIEVASIAS